MIRWHRVRLALSIIFAEGLWKTGVERFQWANASPTGKRSAKQSPTLPSMPRFHDYAGAAHIHSTYSDGTGTVPEIAAAARAAGLDFVLMADHNTVEARTVGDECWHADSKVLVAIGSEVTTTEGHLLAFDVPAEYFPSPFDAVEAMNSIHAHGGYGYIALPCDLKGHWNDFGKRVPGIGLEVFNLSAIGRSKINIPGFLVALFRYKRNPLDGFSLISGRPDAELKLWDDTLAESAAKGEAMPHAIGCLDAHAVMRIAGREFPYPTYEEIFRTLRTHVLTSRPLSSSNVAVADDLSLLHDALRSGRSYISYDNFGDPKGFVFELRRDGEYAGTSGDTVATSPATTIAVRVPKTRSVVRLFRDGKLVNVTRGGTLDYNVTQPGIYRAEVYAYRWRIGNLCLGSRPWIFTNPIHVSAVNAGQGSGSQSGKAVGERR